MKPDDVAAELERILSSDTFASSEILGRFLEHAVLRALEGRGSELKESILGTEVFVRGKSYDPRLDSIVRVHASRLRAKLGEYYRGEGECNVVHIELPTGGYVPIFNSRVVEQPLSNSVRAKPLATVIGALLWAVFGYGT